MLYCHRLRHWRALRRRCEFFGRARSGGDDRKSNWTAGHANEDERDGHVDRGDGSCCRLRSARHTDFARAKSCWNVARWLAGGLWPGSSAPQFQYFPAAPRGTRLRRGEEPHYRAAIRRLQIRPGIGISNRTRPSAGRCSVHPGHEGVANRGWTREDHTACHLLVRPIRARHTPRSRPWKFDRCYMHDNGTQPKAS